MTATCPRCDHDAYDTDCDEYENQSCCGYVEHIDSINDPDSHHEECVNAPAWMKND